MSTPTYKSLNAVRTTLSNAYDIATEPEVKSALATALEELDAMIDDLVRNERANTSHTIELLRMYEIVPPHISDPLDLAGTASSIAFAPFTGKITA